MSKQICSACGATVSRYDGVSVGYKEGTRFMCSRCYNESMAEYSGLDYEHVSFDPLTAIPENSYHTLSRRHPFIMVM